MAGFDRMALDQSECAVLLAEDEPMIRMLAVGTLEQAGVQSFEASDAQEALSQLEQHSNIAVLFTDISMPGTMDGTGLAAVVHEQHAD